MYKHYKNDWYAYGGWESRLREELKNAGMTQKALCEETGICQSQLSKMLHGDWIFITDGFWLKLKKCEYISLKYVKYGLR